MRFERGYERSVWGKVLIHAGLTTWILIPPNSPMYVAPLFRKVMDAPNTETATLNPKRPTP